MNKKTVGVLPKKLFALMESFREKTFWFPRSTLCMSKMQNNVPFDVQLELESVHVVRHERVEHIGLVFYKKTEFKKSDVVPSHS